MQLASARHRLLHHRTSDSRRLTVQVFRTFSGLSTCAFVVKVASVTSSTIAKWQRLSAEQRGMLTEAIFSVCEVGATFEEFADIARSFMESIAGLETLTEL